MHLTDESRDAVLNKLAELASSLSPDNSGLKKKASTLSSTERDQFTTALMRDPSGRGLRRVAYAMTEPLRKRLDYMGIGRKLLDVDLVPQGVIPLYHRDFPEIPGVKVSMRGNPDKVESNAETVELDTFEISTMRSIKYSEIARLRFNALDRTKKKSAFELKLAEDDEIFGAIDVARAASAQNTDSATNISRSAMSYAFGEIEGRRNVVGNVTMHAHNWRTIRGSWDGDDLDQVNIKGLLENGFLGGIWGSKIWITDRLAVVPNAAGTGTNDRSAMLYCTALKEQFGKFAIRYDAEIKPWDYPPGREVLFVVYEHVGILIHNNDAVATVTRT